MQLVVHSPLGARINRAWGLALRKRFCRSFDFELQAAADDDGIVLSLGPQHSFPIDALFKMLNTRNGRVSAEAGPAGRADVPHPLALERDAGAGRAAAARGQARAAAAAADPGRRFAGLRVSRRRSAAWRIITAISRSPIIRWCEQTVLDCLHEAMDLDRWLELLGQIERGEIELVARDTREPSPFSHKLLNANPYAFLDDAPLEERRARAVATRRTLSIESVQDLGRLDADAIARSAAMPGPWSATPTSCTMHCCLSALCLPPMLRLGGLGSTSFWPPDALLTCDHLPSSGSRPSACRWPAPPGQVRRIEPDIVLPESLQREWEVAEARVALVRGRLQISGPMTASIIAEDLNLETSAVEAALVALEGEGLAMRGHFTPRDPASNGNTAPETEWCERRLLARIHRLTLEGLRRRIQPVEVHDYLRFLVRYQRLVPDLRWRGQAGVREALVQLQGYEAAAASWERSLLPSRVRQYDAAWLDQLSMLGELTWGRLRPPRKTEEDGPSIAQITRSCPDRSLFPQGPRLAAVHGAAYVGVVGAQQCPACVGNAAAARSTVPS